MIKYHKCLKPNQFFIYWLFQVLKNPWSTAWVWVEYLLVFYQKSSMLFYSLHCCVACLMCYVPFYYPGTASFNILSRSTKWSMVLFLSTVYCWVACLHVLKDGFGLHCFAVCCPCTAVCVEVVSNDTVIFYWCLAVSACISPKDHFWIWASWLILTKKCWLMCTVLIYRWK